LVGSVPSVLIFTLLAIGELIADKLPKVPNRTSAIGLIGRIVTGSLSGACVSAGLGYGALAGALVGATGGVVGAFVGFYARTRLTTASGGRGFYVALLEDIITVGGCVWIVSQL